MFALLKLILTLYSGEPKLPLIPKVVLPPRFKKLFLRLSEWDNEPLSTPKMITFLAVSISKLQEPALSNVIPYYLSLVAPNIQFLNLKL